jgi:toxin ParE1/3/4
MQLRWSEEAASDLERITNYLFEETPQHAPELVRAIYKAPSALLTFPHRGRPGKKENTRELVLSPLPYITSWSIESPVMLSTFSAFCTAHRNGRRVRPPETRGSRQRIRYRWNSVRPTSGAWLLMPTLAI